MIVGKTTRTKFDLREIDQAKEVLFTPLVNQLPRFLDNPESQPVDVYSQIGDDSINYRMEVGAEKLTISGSSVGEPFTLVLDPKSSELHGRLPGGEVDVLIENSFEGDTFQIDQSGRVGTIPFTETTRFGPARTTSEGQFGGTAHRSEVEYSEEGKLLLTGTVGDTTYRQTIFPVPNGLLAVGNFGGEPLIQWAKI